MLPGLDISKIAGSLLGSVSEKDRKEFNGVIRFFLTQQMRQADALEALARKNAPRELSKIRKEREDSHAAKD